MSAIYLLDQKRYRASVRRSKNSVPVRTTKQYIRWVVSIIKRQSRMFWLIFAECALLYGAFYTFLAFAT